MVLINTCFAPWTSKEVKNNNTHSWKQFICLGFVGHSLTWTESQRTLQILCVRAHTVWVLVRMCVCALGVGGLAGSFTDSGTFGLCPMCRSELWAQRWIMGRDAADVPLFCGCSCTFLSSECVNLYMWCENSSINVYQENGTKTKNVTF